MIDRHWIGDIALAIVLSVPTVALSRPQAVPPQQVSAAPLVQQAALADRSSAERRFGV